ncbi:unnamed protein product, partial [Symbiodinium pilosum]
EAAAAKPAVTNSEESGGAKPSHPAPADPKVEARSQSAGLAEELYREYYREHGCKPPNKEELNDFAKGKGFDLPVRAAAKVIFEPPFRL